MLVNGHKSVFQKYFVESTASNGPLKSANGFRPDSAAQQDGTFNMTKILRSNCYEITCVSKSKKIITVRR